MCHSGTDKKGRSEFRASLLGWPAHRSSGHEEYRTGGTKRKEGALYPRPETRGFTARRVVVDKAFVDYRLSFLRPCNAGRAVAVPVDGGRAGRLAASSGTTS